jgi:hypothetical protein
VSSGEVVLLGKATHPTRYGSPVCTAAFNRQLAWCAMALRFESRAAGIAAEVTTWWIAISARRKAYPALSQTLTYEQQD